MKKFFRTLHLLAAFSVVAYFAACSNSSSSPILIPQQPDNFSWTSLSSRAYIGGSVIYNPDNSDLSRLYAGAKIATRTSKLVVKSSNMQMIADSARLDFRKDGPTVSVDENGKILSGTIGGPERFDYIEDDEDSAVYGFITVSSVSKTSISFVYSYYASASSCLLSQSVSLNLGQSAKLGSSGSEVKYEEPQIARRGFENSSWLTFVNDKDKKTSCMYSCMTELDSSKKSLYGVNSNCDFIYIVGNSSNNGDNFDTSFPTYAGDRVSYGDYIIDQESGRMYSVAGDPSANLNSVLKSEDDYKGHETSGGVEDFIFFSYDKWQFPDTENGPKNLFEAFPKSAQESINNAFASAGTSLSGSDLFILKLNWAMCDRSTLLAIAEDFEKKGETENANALKGVVGNEGLHTAQVDEWKNKLLNRTATPKEVEEKNEQYIEAVRFILDELYDDSPDAYVDPPSMFNVYPDISLNLRNDGDSTAYYNSTNLISANLEFSAFKSVENAKNYSEYTTKRDAIVKKFNEFHHLDLAKVNGTKLSDLGLSVSIGVKGTIKKNLSISAGEFGVKGLGAALFVKAEASLQNTHTGNISFLDDETKKKLNKDLGSIKFNIGPVPFIYKTTVAFDVGWNATVTSNIKYVAGITAMYGGEIDLGAQWGVRFKWKVIPIGGYFNTWPTNTKVYDDSVFYVGPADIASDKTPGLDVGVWVKGTLTPSLGVGFEYISAGLQTPFTIQPEVHYIFDAKTHLKGLVSLTSTFGPFFQVTIPIIGKKFKTEWTAVKLLDYKDKELFDIQIN